MFVTTSSTSYLDTQAGWLAFLCYCTLSPCTAEHISTHLRLALRFLQTKTHTHTHYLYRYIYTVTTHTPYNKMYIGQSFFSHKHKYSPPLNFLAFVLQLEQKWTLFCSLLNLSVAVFTDVHWSQENPHTITTKQWIMSHKAKPLLE